MEYKLLTNAERVELPMVMIRRKKFKNIIVKSIKLKDMTFSNGVIITGKPGSGKTTMIMEFLEELKSQDVIDDYSRCSGHITQTSLFQFLRTESPEYKIVHVLDDTDCMYDGGDLEILKAALDTRNPMNPMNRHVNYLTRGNIDGYAYSGFCIMITNDPFLDPSPHQRAVLDRVHLMELEMSYEDYVIFNTHLVEEYLNQNPDVLSEEVRNSIAKFYDEVIRKWFDAKVFQTAGVNFSIRLIKKFIDLIIMFGDEWQNYSVDYKRINLAYNGIK